MVEPEQVITSDRHDAKQPSWPLYRALVGVGTLSALLIVVAFITTGPAIKANQAEALERAIYRVLPDAVTKQTFDLSPEGTYQSQVEGSTLHNPIYAGYKKNGDLVGLAVAAEGMGYQDTIRILYGYDPVRQQIIGMAVLQSKETPGLGDRIETYPSFIANFQNLDVTLNTETNQPIHPVIAVKEGLKSSAWQVDGITGATISSKAIATIIRQSSQLRLPNIYKQRHRFLVKRTEQDSD